MLASDERIEHYRTPGSICVPDVESRPTFPWNGWCLSLPCVNATGKANSCTRYQITLCRAHPSLVWWAKRTGKVMQCTVNEESKNRTTKAHSDSKSLNQIAGTDTNSDISTALPTDDGKRLQNRSRRQSSLGLHIAWEDCREYRENIEGERERESEGERESVCVSECETDSRYQIPRTSLSIWGSVSTLETPSRLACKLAGMAHFGSGLATSMRPAGH